MRKSLTPRVVVFLFFLFTVLFIGAVIVISLVLPAIGISPDNQIYWIVASAVVIVSFIASVAQFTGYSLKDLVEYSRGGPALDALPGTERYRRYRKQMLQTMHEIWIKGVFEKSLYESALLELGLERSPEQIVDPLRVLIQKLDTSDRTVPPGTKIIELFDEAGGALLILGAPGSGKTTMLLELARDLIDRAERDESEPMPVVFRLSSWAENRLSLAEWLMVELHRHYEVQPKLGQLWMANRLILPLLDGLDEVKKEARDECAAAINQYRSEHGLGSLVVTSRLADYDVLPQRLRLHDAVVLQPLTLAQVDAHLSRSGARLSRLREAIQGHKELQGLAETPLMFSIMMIVYQGEVGEVTWEGIPENRRTHLVSQYVKRMLERSDDLRVYVPNQRSQPAKSDRPVYSQSETLHWLAWLATAMTLHGNTVFYLGHMRYDWLPTATQTRIMQVGASIVLALAGGLAGALLVGPFGMIFGGLVGAFLGYSETSETYEILHWSWTRWRRYSRFTLGIGLVSVLTSVLISMTINAPVADWGPAILLAVWVLLLINSVEVAQIAYRHVPDEKLWRPAQSTLFIGLFVGLGVGMFKGLNFGLVFGLVIGLLYGGSVAIKYIILRLLLWRNKSTPRPWDYVRFLDYAADRVLLRKVGGGYMFIHPLVMEYFANLEA